MQTNSSSDTAIGISYDGAQELGFWSGKPTVWRTESGKCWPMSGGHSPALLKPQKEAAPKEFDRSVVSAAPLWPNL